VVLAGFHLYDKRVYQALGDIDLPSETFRLSVVSEKLCVTFDSSEELHYQFFYDRNRLRGAFAY